jgi:hypothetical protein
VPKTPLTSSVSHAPKAEVAYTNQNKKISENDWSSLSLDLYQSINASLGERQALEDNLKDWNDLYEMRVDPTDWPWANASNVFIPLIPAQLDTAVAYIAGKVFVPRFYIVTGNTPDAATTAHDVERYYNAELVRQRGATTWYNNYITWLRMAFRDGTAVMEVLWKKKVSKRSIVTFEDVKDDTGVPIIDMQTGRAKSERKITQVEVVDYDDVELQPVLLRDFLLFPDEAASIEEAVGVARALWLYEDQLMEMVRDGVLDGDEVERALSYVPTGTNDFASDRQGIYDRTMGDQIVVGLGQGAQHSRFYKNRGPIKVWRIHSRQYDMNGDGVPEENIYYLHELSQRMLGFDDYEYVVDVRPYFSFCPYPRAGRFYGYSLVERLAPIQAEINSMYNARNNLIDLMLNPPLLYGAGEEMDDKEQQWGPGVKWEVSDPSKIKWMEFPQVPLASFQNEALLNSYVDKLTGVSAPIMGAQSSGRRSAAETKIQAASTGTRNDEIALELRAVCRAILNFTHKLKLQYINDDPEFTVGEDKFVLPREVLGKDYQLDIAGSSDPLDMNSRRQENLGLFQLLMQVPWIGQDPVKSFNAVRMVLEAFNRPDTTALIGTDQEAAQRAQQQAAQAQAMQQHQQQLDMIAAQNGQKPQQPQQGKGQSAPKPPM